MVTDRSRLAASTEARACARLLDLIGWCAAARIDLVQIRERDFAARRLREFVVECVRVADGTSTRVLVNDRVDVALAAGAAGVHLRESSFPASAVRRLAPQPFVLGRSVHHATDAAAAARGGQLDYMIFGTVFPSRSKPGDRPPAGIAALALTVKSASCPVLAIGGITAASVGEIARSGAAGFAGIDFFLDAAGEGVAAFVERIAEARRQFDSARTPS